MTSVDLDITRDHSGRESLLAKFANDSWEVNVQAEASEFLVLRDIRSFDWNERRAAQIGRCAGALAYWSSDGQTATVVIGDDDETWDVAVSMPVEAIDDLVRQVAALAL